MLPSAEDPSTHGQDEKTNLCPLPVILILARKALVLKSIQDFTDSFGGLCQHGLQWYAGRELTVLRQVLDAVFEERRYDVVVGRKLTEASSKVSIWTLEGDEKIYL